MQVKEGQVFKFLAIISFLLLTRNLFLLRFAQPTGYVVDIYSMFPLDLYLSFIFCYFIATFLIMYNYKKLGVIILCLNHLEILLIPFMLGYYSMGRADDMSYIGEYLQIATSGHFAAWDIYPASHIIGAFLSLVSGSEAHYVSFVIPIIFSFIFITGIYLFSRELTSQSIVRALVILSSFILYMGYYNFLNVPHALFFAFLPLYLCYFNRYIKNLKNMSFSIVFILMTLLIPITHPFIVLFVFSFFLLHMVPKASLSPYIRLPNTHKVNVSSFLILIISFMSWFAYNNVLKMDFKRSYFAFINKITEPVFFGTTEKLAKINLSFFDYLQLIGLFYGRYIIPTFFILISFILIYQNRKLLKNNQINEYSYLLILYFTFLILQIVLLFNPLVVHQPDRITSLNFVVYSQIPLFSIALYLIFFQKKISFSKILQVSVILAFIWSLSFFGCFESPNIYKTNAALTYNEVYGMEWFYREKGDSIINVPLSQLNRFHDLFGDPEKDDKLNYLPDHFGYVNESDFFADVNLGTGVEPYIVVLTLDELLYQKVKGYIHVGRYKDADFVRFRKDITVSKIYDSTNIEIFKSRTISGP